MIGHIDLLKYKSVLKVGRILPEKRQIVSDAGHKSQIVLEEGLLDKIKNLYNRSGLVGDQ